MDQIERAHRRMAELRAEISEHDRRYYIENFPIISDQEYDRLYRELKDLEAKYPELVTPDSPTQRVGGAPLKAFGQVRHRQEMLSLDNTYSSDEVLEFFRRMERLLPSETIRTVVEPKVDGVAISLFYENGELKYAATRGNGVVGDDVTANVRTIRSVPLRLPSGVPSEMEVRGEVYFPKKAFRALNETRKATGEPEFANPRNTAAGTLKQLDPRMVAERRLGILFYGFGFLSNGAISTHQAALQRLKDWRFPSHDRFWVAETAEEVRQAIEELGEIRHDFPYETDGAVIKVDDYGQRERLGFTSKAPRWAIAYKYQAEQAETRLLSVDVQVGRTGKLTPVANLEPILLSGTTVARATLHNGEEIARKDIRVGDIVVVEKSGEIIPAVIRVRTDLRTGNEQRYVMPRHCPSCGHAVVQSPGQVDLRCPNPECPEQVKGRVHHFAHRGALDIEGLGHTIIGQLVDRELVRRVDQIYDLTEEKLQTLDRLGPKSIANLLTAIAKSKEQPFWRLLFGLGIPHIGATAARELADFFGTMDALQAASLADLLRAPNTGEIVAQSVVDWFSNSDSRALLAALRRHGLNFGVQTEDTETGTALSGQTWVITGTLGRPRQELAEVIRRQGGRVATSVSKKTDFLLVGADAGSKLEKAKELGVKTVTEAEFNRLLGEG